MPKNEVREAIGEEIQKKFKELWENDQEPFPKIYPNLEPAFFTVFCWGWTAAINFCRTTLQK